MDPGRPGAVLIKPDERKKKEAREDERGRERKKERGTLEAGIE